MTPSSTRRLLRALACAAFAATLAVGPAPAYAEPGVPDDGERPRETGGELPNPPELDGVPISGPGITRGPYAEQIGELAREVAELGEKTTAAEGERDLRISQRDNARGDWIDRQREADALADLAADLAAEAYMEATVGDLEVLASYEELFDLYPELYDADGDQVRQRAEDAVEAAAVAAASLDAAVASEAIATSAYQDLADELDRDSSTLAELIEENQEAIEAEEAKAEAANEQLAADLNLSAEVDGMEAAPAAQDAARWAVQQSGAPYEWGAEGPTTFDCSGLMLTSYDEQGVSLPRVSRDQYRGTLDRAVPVEKLLPGDLIFYGDRPGDWSSVYHVGMYVGGGEMVHAPRTGDVVKVVPVWFNDFFGAHRVVPAVDAAPDGGVDQSIPPATPEPAVLEPASRQSVARRPRRLPTPVNA